MHKTVLAFTVLAVSAPAFASETSAANTDAVISSYSIKAAVPTDFIRAKRELAAGNYGNAARLLEYLADGSRNPEVPLLAGYANLGAGKVGRAELYFGRTLALDYANPQALQELGLAALARGDRGAATAQLGKLELARRDCARLCSRGAELDRAIASLRGTIG